MIHWAILTGEYPPQTGGVADYTRQVALGLAAAGDEVDVFAPPCDIREEIVDPGINVHHLPDHFGPRGLASLDHTLSQIKADRLLIQYVPHAYGWKAMNVPFAIWVATRARRHAPIWVMFHEVAFPFHWRPVTHALLGTVTRAMARLVAGAADRVFSSIAAWGPLIQRLCPRAKKAEWLPIPSNLLEDRSIAAIRTSSGITIGHFGTYGPSTVQLLEPALISLLGASNRKAVLLGRGCVAFRDRFVAQYSSLADRLVSLGELPANELAAQLKGCDVLLQPFIDGISSRRTSVMACLSNGVPLVSNLGELSEPLWADLGCIGLAQRPNAVELITATEAILSMTPVERAAMGQRAAMEYRTRFSIENTISRLRDACPRTKA